nr:MAG TPA: hypothetical protein [Caudoviricetes sp.]
MFRRLCRMNLRTSPAEYFCKSSFTFSNETERIP